MRRQLLFAVSCLLLLAVVWLTATGSLEAADGERAAVDAVGNEVVLTIPAGSDGVTYSAKEAERLTWGPTALAVATDGSYWIADAVSNRLLHYSKSGQRLDPIDLAVHRVVGVGDLDVSDAGLFVLDIAAINPRVLHLSYDGKLQAAYDVPKSLGLENGLSGIALGEHGEVLVEREGGAFVSVLASSGVVAVRALDGYSFRGQVYSARAADLLSAETTRGSITTGDRTIEVRTPSNLAGLHIVGVNSDRSFFAVVEEAAIVESAVIVDQTVRQYRRGRYPLQPGSCSTGWAVYARLRRRCHGPDGAIYALLTQSDQAQVARLTFRRDLEPILPKASPPADVSGSSESSLVGCLTRAAMLATADGYVNNTKYLSAANTDGSCAGRSKPHYLGGAGTYPSVSYDMGGWDTVSDWNGYMDPNKLQAGDTGVGGSVESCSRGVDCSGWS